jgi:predicted Rossmann-fold nucleotide-binding protein
VLSFADYRTNYAFDRSPDEIESLAELDYVLRNTSLAGLTVQGLDLSVTWPSALDKADVTETLFIGCVLPNGSAAELVGRGAHVIPAFPVPYPVQPNRLYRPEDLAAGFTEAGSDESGFAQMYDNRVYQHFLANGGTSPSIREALAQRLHDHGIDNALGEELRQWQDEAGGPVVGIMGGHAEPRGSDAYRDAARIGYGLGRGGALVVTGGGPGVMEATNLGAHFADQGLPELSDAIQTLAQAPSFRDPVPYTAAALAVRQHHPVPQRHPAPGNGSAVPATADATSWARQGGLAIPTWLYGHEPANLFAGQIAKYFSNAIREDVILRLARGGIIFAPGKAGTIQEVFQAATKTFYATDGTSGPFVFLGRDYWTRVLPVESLLRPVLEQAAQSDLGRLVRVTDHPEEAVEIILAAR